ncbi:Agamous-like MADS-box protein AGL62 [Euphorbia peplus]|nr:Agamous-like MADS-box protein AGL62 [Euphorbia peplus]
MVKSRKLPMEERPSEKARSVTLTKRRQGLFNKAAEFSILCDSQIAVIVSPSQTGTKPKRKVKSFGHSSVGSVIDAFLNNCVPHVVDDRVKEHSVSLLNEINSMEETLNGDDESGKSRVELGDFESSESVEELEKLVEGMEKLVDDTKRNPKFTCGESNCDNNLFDLQDLHFGFDSDDKAIVPADASNNADDQFLEKLVDDTMRNPKFTCGESNCNNHLFDLQDLDFGFDSDNQAIVPPAAASNNGDDELFEVLELAEFILPELLSAETSPKPKLSSCCDNEINGSESKNSREEGKWSFRSSDNYEYLSFDNENDQESHLPYIDYWPSSC